MRDLAGVLISNPVYRDDGKAGPGLYARASVLPQYKDVIEALAPHIGVSIRAHGQFAPGEAEGKEGRIVNQISKGESVDFVTKPGAGGKVLALMESLRQKEASDVAPSPVTTESGQEEESMELARPARIAVTAIDCVIAPRQAMFQLVGPESPQLLLRMIHWNGEGSLLDEKAHLGLPTSWTRLGPGYPRAASSPRPGHYARSGYS